MTMTGNLSALDSGGTKVDTSMEVAVIGKLAQFGTRLMEDVSNRMFDQFVTCFENKLNTVPAPPAKDGDEETAQPDSPDEEASAPEPINAIPLFFSVLKDAIARTFGRLFGRGRKD